MADGIVTYKYQIKLDIFQDARNWYDGCNRKSHGLDWKQRAPIEVVEKIINKSRDDAYGFILPFLEQKYINDKQRIDNYISLINDEYNRNFTDACQKIEELTGKPIYRHSFTVFLTTFPRGPYNYDLGYLWIPIGALDPIRLFMHELLHFQFIHYWKIPGSPVYQLNSEQEFEWLKESLTVVLDEDLFPLIKHIDKGYDIHQKFRKELHNFWKMNRNFDELVRFGLKIMLEVSPYT